MRTAVALGFVLLASACGGSRAATSVQPNAALDFARCTRSHGVPTFPDPDPQGNFPSFDKRTSAAAYGVCKHLLAGTGGSSIETQGDKTKLAFALKVAQCMRTEGFPTYPDPPGPTASSQGSGTRFAGTGIDTRSPRFQTTETTCESQQRKALGLP